MSRAARIFWAILLLVPLASPRVLVAQDADLRRQIQESQKRLEEIRAERKRLQEEMQSIGSRVEDVSGELQNIERQMSASRSALEEVRFQVDATSSRIQKSQGDLMRTRENLRERSAILSRRLRDIYKRGPLHTVRVLLGAESFSDLLNRYRYLKMIASYDRLLVDRVGELESDLMSQSRDLEETLSDLGRLRQERLSEVAELRKVEEARRKTLEEYRGRAQRARTRLDQLQDDEERLTGLVEDLERRRREAERRRRSGGGAEPGSGSLSDEAKGTLNWPVDGKVIYSFGRDQRPDGTVLRWNGVGIAAPTGTPVRAVRAGRVVQAGPFEGYGPTVVLSHGGGFYTLYLYLEEIGVVEGRDVQAGQVVGTVGGAGTPEGPHMEFQIRIPVEGGSPRAVDPLQWLRDHGGGS